MAIPRSEDMVIVAYALARCGRRDTPDGPAMPPMWLGSVGWGDAYQRFYPALGAGRTERAFANSLKNARDMFDAHVDSGRIGWVDHSKDHRAYRATGLVKKVLDDWSGRTDDDLRLAALDILGGKQSAPTSDQALLDVRTRVARRKFQAGAAPPPGNRRPAKVETVTLSFVRDPKVRAFVLEAANGKCEACDRPAPFLDHHGEPFLEVHHLNMLAEDGPDVVENALATCPNCHRRLHHSSDRDAYRSMVLAKVPRLVGSALASGE